MSVLLLAGALGASPLCADDLSGRIVLGWQTFDSQGVHSDGLSQLYDIGLQRQFTEPLFLRLRLRAEDDASGSTLVGTRRESNAEQLQPGIELRYLLPYLQLQAQWDEIRSTYSNQGSKEKRRREIERLNGSVALHRELWPGLTFYGERRSAFELASGTDMVETLGTATVAYEVAGFRAGGFQSSSKLENRGLGFERRLDDLQGSVGYAHSFWEERVQLDLDALVGRGTIDERAFFASGAKIPNPVSVAEVLTTHDESPGDHLDAPPTSNPALSDGALDRPAGVSLGPQAATNLNLVIDLGRFADVDELRIVVRDSSGRPVTAGESVIWDLYQSVDGRRWDSIPERSLTRFDAAQGFWSVEFDQLSVRWLQLVTFFVNEVPTELTEILAIDNTDLPPGAPVTTHTQSSSQSGSLTVRPVDRIRVSWYGQFNSSSLEREFRPPIESRDASQTLTLMVEPTRWSSIEVQRRTTDARRDEGLLRLDQSYDAWTGVARVSPNQNLSASAQWTTSQELLGTESSEIELASLQTYARLWRAVEINLSASELRTRFLGTSAELTSPSFSALLRAALTRSLNLSLSASVQRNEIEGELESGPLFRVSDERWYSELTWRPSGRLTLGGRVGQAESGRSSSPLRGLLVEWSPFPGGALRLSSRYDEEVDPLRQRESRRLIVSPRLQVNPRVVLFGSYSYLQSKSDQVDAESKSLALGLITTL